MVCQLRAKERAIFAIQQNEGHLDAHNEVCFCDFILFRRRKKNSCVDYVEHAKDNASVKN
jgi:hypothetical protein